MANHLTEGETAFFNNLIAQEEAKHNELGAIMYRNAKKYMGNFLNSLSDLKWKINDQIFLATMNDQVFKDMRSKRAEMLKKLADKEDEIYNDIFNKQLAADGGDTDESAFNVVKKISEDSKMRADIDEVYKMVTDMSERKDEEDRPVLNANDYLAYVINMLCGTADYTGAGQHTDDQLREMYKDCTNSDQMDIDDQSGFDVERSENYIVWMMIQPPIWYAKLSSDDEIILPTLVKYPITNKDDGTYKRILHQLITIKDSKKSGAKKEVISVKRTEKEVEIKRGKTEKLDVK
jgi:hypothetical protein